MTAEHRRCLCSALKGFPFPETFRDSVSCLSTFEAKSNILPYQMLKGVIHQHLQSPVQQIGFIIFNPCIVCPRKIGYRQDLTK